MEVGEDYLNVRKVERKSALELFLGTKAQLSSCLLRRKSPMDLTSFEVAWKEETELAMNYELELSEQVLDFKVFETESKLVVEIFALAHPDVYFMVQYVKGLNALNVLTLDMGELEEKEKSEVQRQYLDQNLLVTLRQNNFPACVEISVQEMSSLMQWRFKYPLKVEARVQLVDEAIVEAFNKVSLSSLVLL